MQSISERLVSSAWASFHSELSDEVHQLSLGRVVDTLSCMVLGTGTETMQTVSRIVDAEHQGQARLVGRPGCANAYDASLHNGALAHALDFDDTSVNSAVHTGTIIVPAALAVAESKGATLAATLKAVAVGYAALDALGAAINPIGTKPHHSRGFHTTATLGTFGAALVAALLGGLSEREAVNAIGVAGSSAAGLLQCVQEGGPLKRLQAGLSSAHGVEASALAGAGVEAPRRVFEGRFGFLRAHGGSEHDLDAVDCLDVEGALGAIATKFYPACHHCHPIIDAIVTLRAQTDLRPERIDEVRIRQPSAAHLITGEPVESRKAPRDLVGAQMSAYSIAAAAIRDGDFGLEHLEKRYWEDPEVIALSQRVTSTPDAEMDAVFSPSQWPAEVRVLFRDGSTAVARVDKPIGFPDDPRAAQAIVEKWNSSVASRSKLFPEASQLQDLHDCDPGVPISAYLDRLLIGEEHHRSASGEVADPIPQTRKDASKSKVTT